MYVLSNEKKVDKIIECLRRQQAQLTNKKRIAVIIGEGSVTSMLPELNDLCDAIILVDINYPVIEHNQRMIELLCHSKDREQFKSEYKKNFGVYTYHMLTEDERRGDWGTLGLKKLLGRAKDVGKEFFLSSEQRFLQCKNAAEQLEIIPLCINVFDLEQVNQLKQRLIDDNSIVSIVNVTNLYEWDANKNAINCYRKDEWQSNNNVSEMLNLLLDNSVTPLILSSAYEKNGDLLLVARLDKSINGYLYEAEQAVQAQIQVYEKSFSELCDSRVSLSQSTFYGKRSSTMNSNYQSDEYRLSNK